MKKIKIKGKELEQLTDEIADRTLERFSPELAITAEIKKVLDMPYADFEKWIAERGEALKAKKLSTFDTFVTLRVAKIMGGEPQPNAVQKPQS